jgi:hypothetical protein
MKAVMSRLGDAMLATVLPSAEAGACCVDVGRACKCAKPCGTTWCTQYVFTCLCACTFASGRC